MKKYWKLAMVLPILLLTACGKAGFDPKTVAEHYADGGLTAQYIVTTHGDFYTEYRLETVVKEGVHTVTILEPASVAGITAVLENGKTVIRYEDVELDALLPTISGCAPMDMLHGLLDDLKNDLPVGFSDQKETVILDYQEMLSDSTELAKQIVLASDSLAVQSAELYLDGDLLLTLRTDSFQWTPAG